MGCSCRIENETRSERVTRPECHDDFLNPSACISRSLDSILSNSVGAAVFIVWREETCYGFLRPPLSLLRICQQLIMNTTMPWGVISSASMRLPLLYAMLPSVFFNALKWAFSGREKEGRKGEKNHVRMKIRSGGLDRFGTGCGPPGRRRRRRPKSFSSSSAHFFSSSSSSFLFFFVGCLFYISNWHHKS